MEKYCKKCEGKVVMHAFSEGPCRVCNSEISTPHIPCDVVCEGCSEVLNVCMSCGGPMNELTKDSPQIIVEKNKFIKTELLTIKELMENSRYIHPQKVMEHMEKWIENANEDKQYLEALILQFYQHLKDTVVNWKKEDHWTDATVEQKLNQVLEEYKDHFCITVQRYGKVEEV